VGPRGGLPTLLQENATRYVVGPGGLPLELVAGSTAYSYSYYQDQLGSTRGLLGATGRGVASASYSPYGVTGGYDGVYQPLGYAGQYTDAESGLQYLRARYYDAATAQFLTRDPLESLTGQPYAYANDSPLNYTDPLGLQCNGPQGASFSVGRLFSSIGDTGCNLGEAKDATLQTAVSTVTPSCASVPGGCRPPTPQEVAAQLGSVKDAALSAGTTTAQDVGMAIRPNCTPLLQDCRLATAAEQLQTTYSIYVGLYGGLNAITFGAEANLGQYAGLTSLECNAQYQQGARLGQAALLATGFTGIARAGLDRFGAVLAVRRADIVLQGNTQELASIMRQLPARNRPTMVGAAIDLKTGDVAWGRSGHDVSLADMDARLRKGITARAGHWDQVNPGHPPGVCAEIPCVDALLQQGVPPGRIGVDAARTSTGVREPACPHCQDILSGLGVHLYNTP